MVKLELRAPHPLLPLQRANAAARKRVMRTEKKPYEPGYVPVPLVTVQIQKDLDTDNNLLFLKQFKFREFAKMDPRDNWTFMHYLGLVSFKFIFIIDGMSRF